MRSLRLAPVLLLLALLLPATAFAHISLDFPNGGEVYSAGEVVTIQWHIYISHPLQNWDIWYTTENGTTFEQCADQAAYPWIAIATDVPNTCANAGGGCGIFGGCTEQYEWTIPEGIDSDQVKIRVRMDNSGTDYFDVSNSPFTITSSSGAPEVVELRGFVLEPNRPNPFYPSTTISYVLDKAAYPVELKIFNASGQLVRTLANGFGAAGRHSIVWNGTSDRGTQLPGGTYLYSLTVGDRQATRKLILMP